MKIFVLSVFLFLGFSQNVYSQCILLDMKLHDCVSCRQNLSLFNQLSTKIPVFAFFKLNMKGDSLDLDYKLSLNNHSIKYIFNDKVYQKYHETEAFSTWLLLDQNGKIVYKGNLKELTQSHITDSISKIVELLPSNLCNYDFNKENIYIFDSDINTIKILKKNDLRSIQNLRPREFDFNTLSISLRGKDSASFIERGFIVNTKAKAGFKPSFKSFDINPSGECFAMLQYIQPFKESDTFRYNLHNCLIKYNTLGAVEKVIPINFDSVVKYDNYFSQFTFESDSTFLTFTHDQRKWFRKQVLTDSLKPINFITKFILDLKDGTFKPSSLYDVDLPVIYRKKYFENYLSSELCTFPYIGFRYANEIHNLNSGKRCNVIDKSVYESKVDMRSTELGEEKYTLLCLNSTIDVKGLYVVYRLDSLIYLKHLDESLNTIGYVCIGSLLENHSIHDCYIDPYSSQIYFTFDGGANALSLPISLYI